MAMQKDGREEREVRMDTPKGVQAMRQCGTDLWQAGGMGPGTCERVWRPKSSLRRGGDKGQKGEEGFKDG